MASQLSADIPFTPPKRPPLPLAHTHTHTHTYSLSLSHTHTHTHTHRCTHTQTIPPDMTCVQGPCRGTPSGMGAVQKTWLLIIMSLCQHNLKGRGKDGESPVKVSVLFQKNTIQHPLTHTYTSLSLSLSHAQTHTL